MNVQTEKIENHIARLTVEIEAAQLDKAKKQAAKKLARHVNIPGFRKGKAPYRILANYVGEGVILEEAVETLGQDVYRRALEESEVEPYTSGELADFKLDPKPTFVFNVPMQPTVEMGDYKSVYVDYEPPTLDDEDVEEAMRQLQTEHALIEESQSPAQMGDRVTADVHGFYMDEEDEDEEDVDDVDEADAEDAEDADEDAATDDSDAEAPDAAEADNHDEDDIHNAPIHEHDAEIYLDTDREPLPGFAEALVGVEPGETREFTLTYPDDEDRYGTFAGREVRFVAEVTAVENVTLPEMNDAFAARVTEDEDEPLTLLELRARVRENMKNQLEQEHRSEYIEEVMDELVERASFAYPEAMIHNQIDSMLEDVAERVGVGVDDYLRLVQQEREDLYNDETYRERAENFIKRSLVMRGILDEEEIEIPDERVDEEIERVVSQFGEQTEAYRSLFDTPEMRANVTNNLLQEAVLDRIVAIGRGEEPEATPQVTTEDTEDTEDVDTAVDNPAEDASEPNEA